MDYQQHLPQIERLKSKLTIIRQKINDHDYSFSSDKYSQKNLMQILKSTYQKHGFKLNPPVSLETLRAFEQQAGISLPSEYGAFLHYMGNGGAGVGYGIYPLGTHLDTYIDNGLNCLKVPSKLNSTFNQELWSQEIIPYIFVEDLADQDYTTQDVIHEKRMVEYYSGLICIATEGCGSCYALIVSGSYYGKVIYAPFDYNICPDFAEQADFLTWYETWLDIFL
ncbi:SMI1/KNR4 family protein [Psychrobacter sp. I-STPA10]|uniref:SMI1/KNR4 family protein n=1 Tax=Psychrobacter sp. I-STPA10 TaxID=2585769 RepID=UPI001E3E93CF|nr:SMI1/KNR4 family protein [Psychrobacter sp. I-STPA10]